MLKGIVKLAFFFFSGNFLPVLRLASLRRAKKPERHDIRAPAVVLLLSYVFTNISLSTTTCYRQGGASCRALGGLLIRERGTILFV